jgi:hypothetical protein
MPCYNCESCTDTTPAIPDCYTGTVTIGIKAIATAYLVVIEKGNGSKQEYAVTSDGAGNIDLDWTADSVDTDWLQSGQYTIRVLDAARVEQSIDDAAATSATCLILNVVDIDQSGNTDIALVYDL